MSNEEPSSHATTYYLNFDKLCPYVELITTKSTIGILMINLYFIRALFQ